MSQHIFRHFFQAPFTKFYYGSFNFGTSCMYKNEQIFWILNCSRTFVMFWRCMSWTSVTSNIKCHLYNLYREVLSIIGTRVFESLPVCADSHIAPLWKLDSTERKFLADEEIHFYVEERTLIYETTDNNMKFIENAALYILALNCGIIVYWIAEYKPIFNDFRTNHGAKNANGERNGKPRNQLCLLFGSEKFIGLNRFIILVKFLSKIIIPFVDSITGKSNRQTVNHILFMIPYNHKLFQEFIISFITLTLRTHNIHKIHTEPARIVGWMNFFEVWLLRYFFQFTNFRWQLLFIDSQCIG